MADQQKGLGERVGNEAHDAADTGNPVKVGGHANAALRAAVAEDDRVDLSCDLAGQLRVTNEVSDPLVVGGNVAHDDVDAGNPIKIGGRARQTAIPAVAVNDDRVDAVFSRTGAITIAGTSGGNPTNLEVNSSGNLEVVVNGTIAHDAPENGFPIPLGLNATEFAADPPQISTDNDRVRAIGTAQGIQWTLGGHPNIIRREYMTTDAETNNVIIATVPPGSHIVITAISVVASASGSTTPQVRIGFGGASVPTEPLTGTSVIGMVLSHPGIAAGSGVVEGNGSGVIAVGGDGEELRITNDVPTGGQITVVVSYFVSTL